MNSTQRPLAAVTGASSGLGLELARIFTAEGFDVIVGASDDDGARRARQALGESGPGSVVDAVGADLATEDGVDRFYEAISAQERPLAAIALNAGIGLGGRFVETDLDTELRLIRTNVESTVHLAKHVVPGMVERGEGRVLITSSIAATHPTPYEAVYGASKAFDRWFAEALHHELSETGVTVTALMPGPTETNFFHRADMDDTKIGESSKDDPAEIARAGFDAMMAGEDKVQPKLANKLLGEAGRFVSDKAGATAHAQLAEPGSGS